MNPFALNEPLVLRNLHLGRMNEFFSFYQAHRELAGEAVRQGLRVDLRKLRQLYSQGTSL